MNDFAIWMEKMGFNRKQVSEAGALLGWSSTTSRETFQGKRSLSAADRMAMASIRAGLPAWTPDLDEQIADVGAVQQIIERAAARQDLSSSVSEEPKAA